MRYFLAVVVPFSALLLTVHVPDPRNESHQSGLASASQSTTERIELFNGRDFTGWSVYDGDPNAWAVKDGNIVAAGQGGGWLMTDRQFSNFSLMLEYRLQPGANTGVILRAPLEGKPSREGLEVQLIDDAAYPNMLGPSEVTGSIWHIQAPQNKAKTRPIGQWNALFIFAFGRKLAVNVNGYDVLFTHLDSHRNLEREFPGLLRREGSVGLQSFSGQVEFRKLALFPDTKKD